ncbi:conserved protein of unknown function [Pseudodesulfovibrio profundus]|uniref:Flagellar Assembly Protein A N-terminal region domain-containing protein n=1 Tax=Pseudodesulfovibrio profundus TaxID=57320 RepID=A0A2C8F9C4_9BACT|nr:FapA family protein [Pseudodesulfovibrio profundus]MBC16000.1 hypothetical protein [Desulfovibrio sp.]SOB59376.1 conserved protein of unknown function [Pseudodesulfovibrio profundus]|tara:strand:- start:1909 stop:3810 length:1902 start_codon:yes stop_codon:yes gene_type:complete
MGNDKKQKQCPDAQFRFAMSEDGMKLGVSRYFPPNGGEEPSVELLRRQVAEAGVSLPIDEDAAHQIIEAVKSKGEIKRIVLVRGIPAQEPQDASLVALGNLDYPVFPGDRFARKHEAKPAQAGQTIDGKPLEPKKDFTPKDIAITMGDNVEFDPLTETYVSQAWGMAIFQEGVLSVEPIPHISEDAIQVSGTLHHQDFKKRQITPAQVEKELRDMGVVIDIDTDLLDNLLEEARSTETPLYDQTLVEGKHPVPGHDGWFEFLVSSREETGTEDESGRLDFRDRGSYPMVNPQQIIGRLHGPTPGEGGIDIYGKTIPAHAGRPLKIHLGENVMAHEDKITFASKAKGVVSMERGTLSVTDCLLISGDVDLGTGNVKLEHGSVKILGSIQAGAVVSAPKHIIVGGSVESATVYAGGNIEIAGGVLMPEGGTIKAEGDISVGHTANARLIAGGDVHITNDITNTIIEAEGTLFATKGKGHIQGGRIMTGKGMLVNEVGSELGVATTIMINIQLEGDEELRQERAKLKQSIARVDDALGTDPPEAILARTPKEKRPAVVEVLKHRITLIKRRKQVSEQINQINLRRQEKLAGTKIKVRRVVHPGVTIKFGSTSMAVKQRLEAPTIYWSENKREIAIG